MNPHLNSILAQQRIAALQRAADHARLATNAGTRRRDSRDSNPVVHALPMPTAHPSPEAWPAAGLATTSPAPARPRDRPRFAAPLANADSRGAPVLGPPESHSAAIRKARRSQGAPGKLRPRPHLRPRG